MKRILALAFIALFLLGCTAPGWECFSDSDCPQPKCLGITAKCDYGKCVYINSNGTLANCSNVSIPNPAAKYCVDKGYKYEIETASDGSQTGYCYVFSPESYLVKCEEWAFYRSECPNCDVFCKAMPHIECIGYWNISGEFPHCKCQYVCPASTICSSDSDCPESYACYNSRFCGLTPHGVVCGDQEGDLLCHKKCEVNSDCPVDMSYCRAVSMAQGDVVSMQMMCMREECKTDSDCPQVRCSGMRSVCIDGRCKVVDSSGHQTRCVNPWAEMSEELCENYSGHWNECGSVCTGRPPGTVCIAVCIAQCECGGIAGWKCPPGYTCRLSGGIADELGVCEISNE
jgi:putative hemolysin